LTESTWDPNLQKTHPEDEEQAILLALGNSNFHDKHSWQHDRIEIRDHAQSSGQFRDLCCYSVVCAVKVWMSSQPRRIVLSPHSLKWSTCREQQDEEAYGVGDYESNRHPYCPFEVLTVGTHN
jgi:hypothetical protein